MSKNRQYPQRSGRASNKSKQKFVLETQPERQVLRAEPDVRKKFSQHDIKSIKPLTENQLLTFQEWAQGQNLVLEGFAGTGKTFLSLCMALNTVLDPETPQDKIIIIRSSVQTRDVGFLPGTEEEKNAVYETPYMQICDKLFKWKNSYKNLKEVGVIEFMNTSFLRGTTWDNAVIIFDEFQNTDEQESDTVMTRVGDDSRIIIVGDVLHQNDTKTQADGMQTIQVLRKMDSVSFIDFKLQDIVRSGFVKEFLMAKYSK